MEFQQDYSEIMFKKTMGWAAIGALRMQARVKDFRPVSAHHTYTKTSLPGWEVTGRDTGDIAV